MATNSKAKQAALLALAQNQSKGASPTPAPMYFQIPENKPQNRFKNLLGIMADSAASAASINADPSTELGDILGRAGNTYLLNRTNQAKMAFYRQVGAIAQDQNVTPEQKINLLVGLTTQHGTDYGLGVKEVVDIYTKQMESQVKQFQQMQQMPLNQARTDYYQAKANQQPSMSPSLQKAKDERVASIIQMSEENPGKIQRLEDADSFLKTLPKLMQGRTGAINIKAMQEADPTNPMLTQWQNLKSVLTEAQLDYVANTKGAVSDREMALFGQAVANDDLISVARLAPQIKKLKNSIVARQNAAIRTFKQLYNEDPEQFAQFQGGNNMPPAGAAFYSPSTQKYYDAQGNEI